MANSHVSSSPKTRPDIGSFDVLGDDHFNEQKTLGFDLFNSSNASFNDIRSRLIDSERVNSHRGVGCINTFPLRKDSTASSEEVIYKLTEYIANARDTDERSLNSKSSAASELSDLLSELLAGGSQNSLGGFSRRASSSFRSQKEKTKSDSLSAHLMRDESFRSEGDHLYCQRSALTRDSDLSGLLSELLAASIIPEDEAEDDDIDALMPLLYEDQEYSCGEFGKVESISNSRELMEAYSGSCDQSAKSDMTGLLSEILSSVAPHAKQLTRTGKKARSAKSLENRGYPIKSEESLPMQSILDSNDTRKHSTRKLRKDNKDRKKSKTSSRRRNELRLKKKESAEKAVVSSILDLIEENKRSKGTPEMKHSVATYVQHNKKMIQDESSPVSLCCSEATPSNIHSCRQKSPTSVTELGVLHIVAPEKPTDHPKPESLSIKADQQVSGSSAQEIFSILPESVQKCLLLLHQQWLTGASPINELLVPIDPSTVEGDEQSDSSDISGFSSVFQDSSSDRTSACIQYPGVLEEYRVEIDGEKNCDTTGLCYRTNRAEPSKPPKAFRKVAFSTLHVRDYESVLGDNPSCEDGPSLSLGWKYKRERVYDIEILENKHERRRGEQQLKLSRFEREERLMKLGYSRNQLLEASLDKRKLGRELRNKESLEFKRFDGLLAGVGRRMNRFVTDLKLEGEKF